MKKRTIAKLMASMMALAVVLAPVAGSPMTAHAYAGIDDGCVEETNGGCEGGDWGDDDSSSSSDSGSSNGGGSSSSGGGSSESYSGGGNSGSSDGGSTGGGSYDAGNGGGSTGGGQAAAPRYNRTPGKGVSAGKQDFRAVANAGAGTYKVIHCGCEKMTFALKGADGNAKACSSVGLKQLADGRYAINFEVADATGCTVGCPLDRTYMYDTLGVNCVTINDSVVIDIEAEAAAK